MIRFPISFAEPADATPKVEADPHVLVVCNDHRGDGSVVEASALFLDTHYSHLPVDTSAGKSPITEARSCLDDEKCWATCRASTVPFCSLSEQAAA